MEVRLQSNHHLNLEKKLYVLLYLQYTVLLRIFSFSFLSSQAQSDQAVARISRPGQLRECESLHLITAGTVEEKVRGV